MLLGFEGQLKVKGHRVSAMAGLPTLPPPAYAPHMQISCPFLDGEAVAASGREYECWVSGREYERWAMGEWEGVCISVLGEAWLFYDVMVHESNVGDDVMR